MFLRLIPVETDSDMYISRNNLIIIKSKEIIEYSIESLPKIV